MVSSQDFHIGFIENDCDKSTTVVFKNVRHGGDILDCMELPYEEQVAGVANKKITDFIQELRVISGFWSGWALERGE